MKSTTCLAILFFFAFSFLNAQHNNVETHEEEKHGNDHEAFRKHHRISAMMAFSHIPSIIPGETVKQSVVVPTYGLNYDFWFHAKWAIGLHNDLILQQYKVESHENKESLVRSYPLAVKAVVLYQPIHDLIFLAGYGKEFETNETLDVITVGVEYGIPIRKGWEANLNLLFDYNVDSYVSWMIGVGFAKNLYHKK
jgi:hypothetical protein